MSKHRKHHHTPAGVSTSAPPKDSQVATPGNSASSSVGGFFSRSVLLQIAAVIGLGCVLGFSFNAASPVGVRFNQPTLVGVTPAVVVAETPTAKPAPVEVAASAPVPVPAPPTAPPPVPVKPVPPPTPPPRPPLPVKVANPAPVVASPATPPPITVVAPPTVSTPTPHVHQPTPGPITAAAIPPAALPNPAPIHWPETKTMVAAGRAVLVDVRHKPMYEAGHIPGAISLPEMSPPEEFTAFLGKQPTNMTVIVYCSSTSCSQSARVATRLANEFRWPSVRYMTGGYMEYQQMEHAQPVPSPTP